MHISVCSTLSRRVAVKHPKHGFLVRDDGFIFRRKPRGSQEYRWTHGSLGKGGYYVTSIRIDDRHIPHTIHRIVAECFLPNYENKPTVDHINRVRTDNRVENLKWATFGEQSLNTKRHYNAIQRWGFTPIYNKKTYKQVCAQELRKTYRLKGLRNVKLPGGIYRWIRFYCFEYPLPGYDAGIRLVPSESYKKRMAKERKREYDKEYRKLKGEERLRQKREYYRENREAILKKQKESRKILRVRFIELQNEFHNW